MRIQKTYFPKETLSQNDWFKTFNVSTRKEKYQDERRSKEINSEYNFSKFQFLVNDETYFQKIIKHVLKFVSI